MWTIALLTGLFATSGTARPIGKLDKIVREYYMYLDAGNIEKLDAMLAEDLMVTIPLSTEVMDKPSFKQLGMGMHTAFPDGVHKVMESLESGNTIAFKAMFTGTNRGELQGQAPTGNRVQVPFLGFWKINEQGLIVEMAIQFDQAIFQAQLAKGRSTSVPPEAIVRNFISAVDAGDLPKFRSYLAPNHQHWFGGQLLEGDELENRIQSIKTGFPDIKRSIDQVQVSGNMVTVQGLTTGTNTGPFAGQPATNHKIRFTWIGIYQLSPEGKVEKGWVEYDRANFESQLKGITTAGIPDSIKN